MNFFKITRNLLLFTALIFASCEVEPLDASLLNQQNTNPTETGDYWPTAINNTWNYNTDGVADAPFKIESIENIGGSNYYVFNNVMGSSGAASANVKMQLRKNSGDYFIRIPGFTVDYGGGITATATSAEFLMFKDYVGVNQTWNSSYTQTFTFNFPGIPVQTTNVVVNGTMLEKGISLAVNGTTFNDVIKFKVVQTGTVSGQTSVSTTNYWYAKHVGLIKMVSETASGNSVKEITSYTLH